MRNIECFLREGVHSWNNNHPEIEPKFWEFMSNVASEDKYLEQKLKKSSCCPMCGTAANVFLVNPKKKDKTRYEDIFIYYNCSKCGNSWSSKKIATFVEHTFLPFFLDKRSEHDKIFVLIILACIIATVCVVCGVFETKTVLQMLVMVFGIWGFPMLFLSLFELRSAKRHQSPILNTFLEDSVFFDDDYLEEYLSYVSNKARGK